jgi:hypothetical protein
MPEPDDNRLQELMHLEMDGRLSALERQRLAQWAAADGERQQERARLARLERLLTASRVPVPAAFKASVLERLPAAGWEARHPRSWAWPLALLAVLGSLGAAFAGLAAGRLEPASPVLSAMAAVGGLLAASMVAGAGLLTASWQGLGVALSGLLDGRPANWIAFAVLVLGIDLLLLRLLRRRAAEPAGSRERTDERR